MNWDYSNVVKYDVYNTYLVTNALSAEVREKW